ncbi:MAG: DUF368 domain-containing protein [Christensenellaceae bacterium]|nr:DUF368 domain-containing protein [Christensenellaceae bacterium]
MTKAYKGFGLAVLQGAIIGVVGLAPGASGGVLAVSMGIYRPIMDALLALPRAFKRSFLFLLPYGIGAVLGMLITARALEWLLHTHRAATMYALTGMVLGGVPSLVRDANSKGFKKRYLWGALCGILLILGLSALEAFAFAGEPWPLTPLTCTFAGGVIAAGTIIPGVSTSFLLMLLGLYEPLLAAFNRFTLIPLACVAVGCIGFGYLLALLARHMFRRYPGYTYYAVLGLLIGTVVLLFPGVHPFPLQLWYALLLALGFAAAAYMCRVSEKMKVLHERI